MNKKQKTILVIDDERDALDLLKMRLESRGYEVLSALDPKGALREASRKPDVILLDLLIPSEKEGLRLFLDLKNNEITNAIPVIFLTGKAGESAKLIGLGALDCVEKPYEAESLLKKIEAVFQKK